MRNFFTAIFVFSVVFINAQFDSVNSGEILKYRIHYGFLNAGFATLSTKKTTYNGAPHLYVRGEGRSSGAVRAFFKVDDIYESYINLRTDQPSFYVRNVSEGSYRKNLASTFNHSNHTVSLHDRIKNETRNFNVNSDIQDMLSSFYYLRTLSTDQLKVGSSVKLNVWIDDEIYPFMLKVVGTEMMSTKFGRINCLKIIPSVMSGRVFKAKEGVTMWVTNDANHIPIQMKAELAVGSLKADLIEYSNVKYPLRFAK
ncbi:DUF3108 domain-containing protein [Elizabethkingia anophelis]|uniref:DUF3108 domain-containing protein n=1 Tax=Elizabethkingia anophelis TaxID=1117645 RepID=UPI00084093A7|nr:DUF3108 domain-containing protein [Elizabethkingia anophelis]MCT4120183.1 DUF3108 domain-containing protein [Elizabethkingia anophelis]MCT4220236.1 DUF3108 domain-containing protein [Elizabethkingia anophelis]MCT4236479.1 DUF3108 domain-containing protein [Elizabethkingia anophelis]MDV3797489.1 DUF3108 domain-containing protein [Elizabethkingia anophelis]OCW72299.1 ATP-dependent exonuclease [Elizabethkingia anophelis]